MSQHMYQASLLEALLNQNVNNRYRRSGDDMTPDAVKTAGTSWSHREAATDLPFWLKWYFPYVVAGCSVFVIVVCVLIIALCCWRRNIKKNEQDELGVQQVCVYSSVKPNIVRSEGLQPEVTHPTFISRSGAIPVLAQPAKIRSLGLLERRGSSQSLTIDLTPSKDDRYSTARTPPKESSAEEFLLSAGNRMTRKELRHCLHNVRKLHEEFWEIPMNHPDKVVVAGSGMKNRYRTIIPNEVTRVLLPEFEDEPLSSYINANYIRGYEEEPRTFIATQGPMAHTLNDFWFMVWHQGAPIIVMITKLVENNKVKCEGYLPDRQDIYGAIRVTVERTMDADHYTVRQLRLEYLNEMRTVWHYWYHDWDDHKAPATAKQLLNLAKEVRDKRTELRHNGPAVVHCSAGIGRTGCFIAISIGMQQLEEEYMTDVLGIVCSMRMDRGGMVQTGEQYEFIHRALCLYEKQLPASSSPAGVK